MYRCRNFYVDIGARLAELEVYRLHYRFLETRDEYFNYGLEETPQQGRRMIYGLNLPDDVLRRVYYENAVGLLKLE